ncbi:MAG TPA: hypothetical protein VMZ92_01815 [Planctomycetota bacterium]|nr:hypothetical protein [Planctomycetota bacterium]
MLWASVEAHAELTPDQAKTAEACIAAFSSREFRERQQAVEKLVALGPDVVGMIKKTLAETQDNEVKLRCEMVLRGVREFYIVDEQDRPLNVGPSRITLRTRQTPLAEVIRQFAVLSGNAALPLKTTSVLKNPVTLDVKDLPYWQAVDELLKTAGLVHAYDWSTRSMVVNAGTPGDDIGAYPGPAMVKLNSVSRVLNCLGGRRIRRLSFGLLYAWEDRLPVIYGVLVVTRARTAKGKELKGSRAAAERPLWVLHNASANVYLPYDVTDDVSGSVSVEGFVRLEYGIGEERVELPLAVSAKPIAISGMTLSVAKVERTTRDLRVTVQGKLAKPFPSLKTLSSRYGLFLKDGAGRRHEAALGANPYVTGGFDTELIYPVTQAAGEGRLEFVCPRIVKTRDYPFELQTVPVP